MLLGLSAVACSAPSAPVVSEPPAENDAPPSEEAPAPERLTGVPGIDKAQDLAIKILDARGTGRIAGNPIPSGLVTAVPLGSWLLADAGSEYEITLRSSLLPDGIVRLSGTAAFLVEPPVAGAVPRFRLFGGQGAFYLPHLPQGQLVVLTPAGPLVSRGAVFTVTVSPDSQVLVTCREGSVFLTGAQNAVAQPGQVFVADRLGRNRLYAMTPSEALPFSDRWLKVMTEEAGPIVTRLLSRRQREWAELGSHPDPERSRLLALWFREAHTLSLSGIPGPDSWNAVLATAIRTSVWDPLPQGVGLLGELP